MEPILEIRHLAVSFTQYVEGLQKRRLETIRLLKNRIVGLITIRRPFVGQAGLHPVTDAGPARFAHIFGHGFQMVFRHVPDA